MGMITGIEENRGVFSVYVDGVLHTRVRKKYFVQLGLAPGQELEEDSFADRLSRLQFKDAYEASLNLLTARDMTAQGMIDALTRRRYTRSVAEAVCQKLVENRLIDDERYAQRYMELHREDAVGKYALKRKLRSKGLSEELVGAALEEVDEQSQLQAARALAAKLAARYAGQDPRAARSKISQALARRGFGWDVISQALEDDGGYEDLP